MCVCVCVTNTTKLQKGLNNESVLLRLITYFQMSISSCGSKQSVFSETGKRLLVILFWRNEYLPGLSIFLAFYFCWWIRVSPGESVSAPQWTLRKRERVFEDDVFIEYTCLGIGSKKRGTEFKRGHSFTQVTWFSWPMVSWDWIFVCVRHLCCGNIWHTTQIKL